ncbi:hypothetical protein [Sphaerochaeta globosa]|uniref:Lipocalin-like domain-containing protein n=1 Tax=Sphaerochaeta globosa (strain ATCC BAA-1886 / DSM 22777 / Buddy) TaxID=158189 RepID=F0RWP9_SPHGB|nr:hypothetical protein [Sphaerochaeta globosa]ADY13680.1 hypothetical protein SpiBuddy_1856 [Sphaerochaeta globosa str. Buddy]
MNKKRLLVVLLIVLSLGIFMSCEESMSVSLKGTWRNVETEEGVTTTTIMVFEDSSFTMNNTTQSDSFLVETSASGTYTKTDSTLTTTITSMTILGATLTGADLIEFAGSEEILTETVDYRITKSGSTVTLTVDDTSYIKQ